jgi:hypothetical protein
MVNLVLKWNVKNQNIQRRDDICFFTFYTYRRIHPDFCGSSFWPPLETRSIIDVLKLKEKNVKVLFIVFIFFNKSMWAPFQASKSGLKKLNLYKSAVP